MILARARASLHRLARLIFAARHAPRLHAETARVRARRPVAVVSLRLEIDRGYAAWLKRRGLTDPDQSFREQFAGSIRAELARKQADARTQ